jgi:hypothetical protein
MITPARHLNNPIDTWIYNYYVNRKPRNKFPAQIDRIRYIVKEVTGYDPCFGTKYQTMERVMSRQLFIYFVRLNVKISQQRLGDIIGKDHATINHAIKCVNKYKDIEPEYATIFQTIDKKLQQIPRN